MKFDAIVGNPPYQLTDGSGGTNDAPIYQYFAEAAQKLEPTYVSLIMPSRWFTTGRENLLGDFRAKMLKSANIRTMVAYTDSKDIFPTVEIKGGLCYYMSDIAYNGDCHYTLHENGRVSSSFRRLDERDILIRNPITAEIVKKVMGRTTGGTVDALISGDTPFGIPTKPKANMKVAFELFDKPDAEHNTSLLYLENMARKIAYIDGSKIKKNASDINRDKVFIPEVGGSGTDAYVLGKPEYGAKNSVCSQTFLYAAFDSKSEAMNFITYLKTKFFRVLVSACKISQHAPSKNYRFVPIQDFSKAWSDAELYEMYDLTNEEIAFIEETIKPLNSTL